MIKQEQDDHSIAPMAVVIVTYNSADVIEDCLDSLLASERADLRVIVVDNKSPDNSIETVTAWAERHNVVIDDVECGTAQTPMGELPWLTLLRSSVNKGFAGGVNEGLRWALPHKEIDLFWILNPDCIVEPQTARAFVDCAARSGEFSLMGGRILYASPHNLVQSDGGKVKLTGMCESVNMLADPAISEPPKAEDIDFIVGASMVASKGFLEDVGLMREDYFLYYEEVDWAARRGSRPLLLCLDAVVIHHVGTSIGSPTIDRAASAFSNYFNFRNRIRFSWRLRRSRFIVVYVWSLMKIIQIYFFVGSAEARAAFLGLHQLPPPKKVKAGVGKEAFRYAFGRGSGV